jgi:hypothetical protein
MNAYADFCACGLRGGVTGEIIEGGEIHIGDQIAR